MSTKKVKTTRKTSRNAQNTIEMLTFLREVLVDDLGSLKSRLGGSPLIFEDNRFTIAKKFLFLSYLIGEVNILYATVWRYVSVEKAADILDGELTLAIGEMEKFKKKLDGLVKDGVELTSLYFKGLLSNYYKFFVLFDAQLEEILSGIVDPVPFEIRIIDVLSCCPTVDVKITLIRPSYDSSYASLNAIYKMYESKCFYRVPDFLRDNTDLGRQSEFVKFVRECVRCANVTYLQKIVNELSTNECQLSFTSADGKIEKMKQLCVCYENLLDNLYQLHTHTSFTTSIGRKHFVNDLYSRQCNFGETPGFTVKITFPYLRMEHLPLMLRNSPDYSSSLDETAQPSEVKQSIRALREYNFSHGIPERPQVHFKFYHSAESKECCVTTSYDRNNKFNATFDNQT